MITSQRIYGSGSIAHTPRTVRASEPWGPERYPAYGSRPPRKRTTPKVDAPTGTGAEARLRATGVDVPLSPRERSEQRRAERRRAGVIRMAEID